MTALDVSLVLPITFMIEGLQTDRVKARLAGISFLINMAVLTAMLIFFETSTAVVGWALISTVTWLLQVIVNRIRTPKTPQSTRLATFLASSVSLVHYVTTFNMTHRQLSTDFFVKFALVIFPVLVSLFLILRIFSQKFVENLGLQPPERGNQPGALKTSLLGSSRDFLFNLHSLFVPFLGSLFPF